MKKEVVQSHEITKAAALDAPKFAKKMTLKEKLLSSKMFTDTFKKMVEEKSREY